ncbi:hypothetical protein T492DRAFT_184114 [Pavlovales sp. CCMP2436]|nr:hypothetical protein T492DRAFT_184114 [Pavlovales sp. CCMP2436]
MEVDGTPALSAVARRKQPMVYASTPNEGTRSKGPTDGNKSSGKQPATSFIGAPLQLRPCVTMAASEAMAGLTTSQAMAVAGPGAPWRCTKLPLKSVQGFRDEACSAFCVQWSAGGTMLAVGTSECAASIFVVASSLELDTIMLLDALQDETTGIGSSQPGALTQRARLFRQKRLDGHVCFFAFLFFL